MSDNQLESCTSLIESVFGSVERIKYRDFTPGINFKNEKLYSFTDRGVAVVRLYPKPAAWKKISNAGSWQHLRPLMNVNSGNIWAWKPKDNNYLYKECPAPPRCKRKEYKQFFSLIPEREKEALSKFPVRQWHILSMIARCPGALELAYNNPALAFCLASNWCFHQPPVKKPLRSVRSLLLKKQKQALLWLGFPSTNQAVNILRKLSSNCLNINCMLTLRTLINQNSEKVKILSHLPRINTSIVYLLNKPALSKHVSFNALVDIGNILVTNTPFIHPIINDILFMFDELKKSTTGLYFKSFKRIVETYFELNKEIRLLYEKDLIFPAAPIQGNRHIIPLNKYADLYYESQEQNNCVASMTTKIIQGKVYLYKVLYPERATLALKPIRKGSWEIREITARCNKKVKKETVQTVERWITESTRKEIRK